MGLRGSSRAVRGPAQHTSPLPRARRPTRAARRWAAVAVLAVLLPSATVTHALEIGDYPHKLLSLDDRATVTWSPNDVRGFLSYGTSPGSYTSRTVSEGVGALTFVPLDEDIAPGIYYCVIEAVGSGERSEEFGVIVESPVFPTPTSPPNGSTVAGTTTVLAWDPIDDVPYYHVVVSDSQIGIVEEDDGIRITGANIVWQALTSATSIQYGSLDPSGYFVGTNGVSPPLMSSFDYNWLVFNNYGGTPQLTSVAGAGIAGFSADVHASVDPPTLLAPEDSVALAETTIDFDWAAVPGAIGYHLYVYEKRSWAGGDASYPVWDGATAEAHAEVHAGSILPAGRYFWRVVALDSAGRGAASELRRFDYETETGDVRIVTRTLGGDPLPRVYVAIEFLEGGVEVLPVVTDNAGVHRKSLIPGTYSLSASKEGYVDTLAVAEIRADETTEVVIDMRRAPARARGVVLDEGGDPVFDALVTARSESDESTAASDASGRFVLALTAGEWVVSASKSGYAPSPPETLALEAGDYVEIADPLVVAGTPGLLSGSILAPGGNPIAGATVRAQGDAGSSTAPTSGSGRFSLQLASGRWSIHAEKSGYRPSEEREVEIEPGGTTPLDPPITLAPVGLSIMGRVTDGEADVVGARVVAVPAAGEVAVATTDNYGQFLILPPAATYTLSADADGFGPGSESQVTAVPGEAFTGVTLGVRRLDCEVAGHVTDGAGAVGDAIVSDGTTETSTAGDGSFRLAVGPGLHEITARKEGCFSGAPLVVATRPGAPIEGLTLEVADGACSVSGRVSADGLGVPGAAVSAWSGDARTECLSDASGTYRLCVEAGDWTVRAVKNGFAPEEETVGVATGQNVTGIDLELEDRSASVGGDVTDALGPVRRAELLLFEGEASEPVYRTSTGSAGSYSLRVAPDADYTLLVRAPGRGSRRIPIGAPGPGESVVSDVALERYGGSIQGTVTGDGEPVEGALVVASWGDSVSTLTDSRGAFTVWVDDGLYDLRIGRPGYRTTRITDVEVVSGEPTLMDVTLEGLFADLTGAVVDSLSETPVAGALVTATFVGGGSSDVTDTDGRYALDRIVAGDVHVRCVAPAHRAVDRDVVLTESESARLDLSMLELTGVIGGSVTTTTGDPVAGASVRAKRGDQMAASALTDAEGDYVLAGLDDELAYDVYASAAGHCASSPNPLTAIATQTFDTDFVMQPLSGSIAGVVLDRVSEEPLAGASVTAEDGAGHFGAAATDEEGAFLIAGLYPAVTYDVRAALVGYHTASLSGVIPDEAPVSLSLDRDFGTLTGFVTFADPELSLADIAIVATSTSYGGGSRTAAPDPEGSYAIAEVRPGGYIVSVSAPGCLCDPSQIAVTIGAGQSLEGIDFTVSRATIERVDVAGPTELQAGAAASVVADVIAEGDRVVDGTLAWWVSPPCAGAIAASGGPFVSSPTYVGEATIAAREESSGRVGRLTISIYVRVDAATEAAFADSSGMTIAFEPGAVAEPKSIHLSHEAVPDAKRYRKGYEIAPLSYRLKPQGLVFDAGREPALLLPSLAADPSIAVWSGETLSWEVLEGERTAEGVEARIRRLGEYATIVPSRALGVTDVRVEPNPFSPDTGPVTVSYDLSSTDVRMPFVTVRIFNMAAQLVRRVAIDEPQGKGRASIQWDGLTDDGEVARNGRYVVEIRAEDSTGAEAALATLALVK
jgi:hypothetical protein